MVDNTAFYQISGAVLLAVILYRKIMGNTLDGFVYRLKNNDAELTELNCGEEGVDAIGDKGAMEVAAALATNTTLTALDLSGMRIGDDGADKLATVLYVNKTLSLLRLHKNKISDKGAGRIALALRYNHTVTAVFISMSNSISDSINKEIQELVTINKAGPEEAARQKAALFGAAWAVEGKKLTKKAEDELAEYTVSASDSDSKASDHQKAE